MNLGNRDKISELPREYQNGLLNHTHLNLLSHNVRTHKEHLLHEIYDDISRNRIHNCISHPLLLSRIEFHIPSSLTGKNNEVIKTGRQCHVHHVPSPNIQAFQL